MSQPFRAFAKDILERQTYPVQRSSPNGPIERPYDVTGWTLPLQMGVDVVEVAKAFDVRLEKPARPEIPAGKFEPAPGTAVAYEISHASNNSAIAVNRLLEAGAGVSWTPAGGIVTRSPDDLGPRLRRWSRMLGIDVKGLGFLPASQRYLRTPRVALYQPWQPNMDEGWTRWLLEQYEFPSRRFGRPGSRRASCAIASTRC